VALANHTILIKKNGEKTYIADSAAPIKDDLGNILGAVLVFRDISDRKNAQKERGQFIHQLQENLAEYNK